MIIIMIMNIYINVGNKINLDKETNKSGLINHLLELHYEMVRPGSFKEEVHDDHIDTSYYVEAKPPKVIKSSEDALEAVKSIFPEARTVGFCKNGHLLQPGRDRCSQKGCKYS